MGKIAKATAFLTGVTLCLFGITNPSVGSTEFPAPTIARFIDGDCRARPQVVFEFPAGAKPSYWEIIGGVRGDIPILKANIDGNTLTINLVDPDPDSVRPRDLRPRLVYKLANGQETRVHGELYQYTIDSFKFYDSKFCKDLRKKIEEEEFKKKLPALSLKRLDYLGYSGTWGSNYTLNVDLFVSSPEPILEVHTSSTLDFVNWSGPGTPVRTVLNSPGDMTLTINLGMPWRNTVALQVRARNKTGWGDWITLNTGRPVGSATLPVEPTYRSDGYLLTTQPIILPKTRDLNLRPPGGCTATAVQLEELSAAGIEPGDSFKVETSAEEGDYWLNEAYESGIKQIATLSSKHNPVQTSLNVLLCPERILAFQPRYLRLKVTKLSNNSFIEGKIKVLISDDPLTDFSRVRAAEICEPKNQQNFANNVLLEQEKIQKTSKQTSVVKGTLFRAGLVAPKQKYFVYLESARDSIPVASGLTDENGQFSFSFNVPVVKKKGQTETLVFVVDEAAGPRLPFNRVFEMSQTSITFTWEDKGLTYKSSSSDWVPQPDTRCTAAIEGIPFGTEGDEKNHVAWFVAKQVYYGMKNKQTKSRDALASSSRGSTSVSGPRQVPSSGGSSGSINRGGSKCTWVNGYTRKSGTRVSGHWRCG